LIQWIGAHSKEAWDGVYPIVFFEFSSYALGFGLNPNIKIRALASSQYGLPGEDQEDSPLDDDGEIRLSCKRRNGLAANE
jgi:hypothetical protein